MVENTANNLPDNDPDNKVLIGILSIFLILLIIGLIIAIRPDVLDKIGKKNKPIEEKETYSMRLSAYDNINDEVIGSATYIFSRIDKDNNKEIISEGTLKKGFITEVNLQDEIGTNYTLKIDSDMYYDTEHQCILDKREAECSANIEKIGNITIESVYHKNNFLNMIIIEKGIWKQPFFCMNENSNRILDINNIRFMDTDKEIRLERFDVPENLMKTYYICYKINIEQMNMTNYYLGYEIKIDDGYDYGEDDKITMLFGDEHYSSFKNIYQDEKNNDVKHTIPLIDN